MGRSGQKPRMCLMGSQSVSRRRPSLVATTLITGQNGGVDAARAAHRRSGLEGGTAADAARPQGHDESRAGRWRQERHDRGLVRSDVISVVTRQQRGRRRDETVPLQAEPNATAAEVGEDGGRVHLEHHPIVVMG